MIALKAIGWFLWLVLSYALVLKFVGRRGLTTMFPEGYRWYHDVQELGVMLFFAVCCICNPWI